MSARRIELVASAVQSGSANSDAFSVATLTMGVVGVDITAITSTPDLDIWLQGSDDGGTTWYDLPYDQQLTSAAAAADLTANTHKRNINGTSSAAAVSKHAAVYKHLAADVVRLAWVLTTGTITFSASLVGK